MISGDPGTLDPNTETGKRMEEYRRVLGELDILICLGDLKSFVKGFFDGYKIMKNGYDVITAQGVEHSLIAWILSWAYGVPWQMQIHTDIFSPYFARESFINRTRVWLAKFLLARASCVRVVSERIKRSLVDFNVLLKDRIVILPVFVDAEIFKSYKVNVDLRQKYPGQFIILMASRITREKNIDIAIEAVSDLNAALVIVGDGPEKENLKAKAGENVKFEPYTADLNSYYKTCDLFLLTSNYEGYGRTLIEAAAAGTRIISSDVGIASEILEEENIFRVGDLNHLKARLQNAISGKIKLAKPVQAQTKEEYLKLYKESFVLCLKK